MGGRRLKLELELPEPIIQHIQSFLTGKEAARTTILSKSWYSAWLTLPTLDFDLRDFIARGYSESDYSKYVTNNIDWYEQQNLKIESLKLCMSATDVGSAYLANKLIVKALGKLGATRLSFRLYGGRIVFPHEVLFGADNLVELSLTGYCKITLADHGMELVKCSRLQSLCLDGVHTTSVDALSNLISCCPLIENLSLYHITYDNDYNYDRIEEHRWWNMPVGLKPVQPSPVGQRNRLRCLASCHKSFKTFFPDDLLSKFPFLADLTLYDVRSDSFVQEEEDVVIISNGSLERVKIEAGCGGRRLKVKLDVPSIRKFTFDGGSVDFIPSLSFESSCTREWESHVSITRRADGFTALWFRKLNRFLTQLRPSKIHLSIHAECRVGFDYKLGDDVSVIPKHELENLTIDMTGLPSFSCYALFDGLFRLCRPKLVTQTQKKVQYYNPSLFDERETNIGLLCQVLDQGIHFKVSDPRQLMYGLNDLEEANAQIFDDQIKGWRPPIPLKSLLSLLEDHDHEQQRVRLLLKWKPLIDCS